MILTAMQPRRNLPKKQTDRSYQTKMTRETMDLIKKVGERPLILKGIANAEDDLIFIDIEGA